MIKEIKASVQVLALFLNKSECIMIRKFKSRLTRNLIKRYTGHWDKNDPLKEKEFRSINSYEIESSKVIHETMDELKMNYENDFLMPQDFCIWIDPNSISFKYRNELFTIKNIDGLIAKCFIEYLKNIKRNSLVN